MKSLKKNYVYQSLYQILMVVTPLITSPYLSRALGPEKIGIYSYCYSIAYYFSLFAILGISNYGNRYIAKKYISGKKQTSIAFFEIYTIQFVASILVVIFYGVYITKTTSMYRYNLMIEVLYVLSVALDVSWFYFGIEEIKTITIRSFYVRLISVICILLVIKGPDDLNLYTVIMAGGSFLSSCILWVKLWRYIEPVDIKLLKIKNHIKGILVLFVPAISLAVFHYMDKVMLGALSTMEEVGFYSNVDKVINIPLGLISSLGIVMMPRISRLEEEGNDELALGYTRDSIVFSSWLSIAMWCGITAVACEFVPVFFGPGYDKCILLLYWFSPLLFIKGLSGTLRMQYIIPRGLDSQLNISVICAAVINIILNYILIPEYDSLGAVIATFVAELFLLIFCVMWTKNNLRMIDLLKYNLSFLTVGMLMIFVVRSVSGAFNNILIGLIIEIMLGAIFYSILSIGILFWLRWKPLLKIIDQVRAKMTTLL